MATTDVAFYVTAHQDDWELFRGEVAYGDISSPTTKVVFIYTTAGDNGLSAEYWQTREAAALAACSIAFPQPPLPPGIAIAPDSFSYRTDVGGHSIVRNSYVIHHGSFDKRVQSYFLRLPDGNLDGNGFPLTGNVSLPKLRDQGTPIAAIDGSTTYVSWNDFVATLRAICALERVGLSTSVVPWLHASDFDQILNPADHPDHHATADALREFVFTDGFNRDWWISYDTGKRPPNLVDPSLANKKAQFDAYTVAMSNQFNTNGDQEWLWWGSKSYGRLKKSTEPD